MKRLTVVTLTVLVALVLAAINASANSKATVCHKAGSDKWVEITISYPGGWVNGHSNHLGDFLVTNEKPCPPDGNNPIVTEQPPVDPPVVETPQPEPPASYTDEIWLPIIAAECVDNGFHVGICTNNH